MKKKELRKNSGRNEQFFTISFKGEDIFVHFSECTISA